MTPIYAHAGDVFFTRSSSWLGRAIRWAETDPGEEPTWANHTGVVVEDGWIGDPYALPEHQDLKHSCAQAIVIEALWHVRRGPLKVNGIAVRVFGPVPDYESGEVAALRAEAETYIGDKYGWWKLLFHLADRGIFRGNKVLSKLLRVNKRPICSYLAAKVCAVVGSTFGPTPAVAQTPDEMLDYCVANPDEWRER